ncbi:hypothetical protein QAD02_017437 [Eretmocerus hayati]|uniref:Uncharacterized protein n=1 Tax=Eretmocerus hayati TaxID=131215 RepID=A0ACC2PIN6_9HYME|nr:hypothetical protein QAD02_017437 [Eretmocerus hayati]
MRAKMEQGYAALGSSSHLSSSSSSSFRMEASLTWTIAFSRKARRRCAMACAKNRRLKMPGERSICCELHSQVRGSGHRRQPQASFTGAFCVDIFLLTPNQGRCLVSTLSFTSRLRDLGDHRAQHASPKMTESLQVFMARFIIGTALGMCWLQYIEFALMVYDQSQDWLHTFRTMRWYANGGFILRAEIKAMPYLSLLYALTRKYLNYLSDGIQSASSISIGNCLFSLIMRGNHKIKWVSSKYEGDSQLDAVRIFQHFNLTWHFRH